jgi:hypothetical protein
MSKILWIMCILSLGAFWAVSAAEKAGRQPQSELTPSNRSKSIKFEDNVVEGMDKTLLDSLTLRGEYDDGQSKHLFKKRTSFKNENEQVLKELILGP